MLISKKLPYLSAFCMLFLLICAGQLFALNEINNHKPAVSFPSIPSNTPNILVLSKIFNNKEKGYSIKYTASWMYVIRSANYVLFSGKEGSPAYYSLVGIHALNYDESPTLEEFIKSDAKKHAELIQQFIQSVKFTGLKFLEEGPIKLISAENTALPAYNFIATYTGEDGEPCKMWLVIATRQTKPNYLVFIYLTNAVDYDLYLPYAKAMYQTWSIKY